MASPRILIVKRDKIGDMLLTTPLLAHLSASLPDAPLDVLCTDYNGWVLDSHPAIHTRFPLPRLRVGPSVHLRKVPAHVAMRAKLAAQSYDVALVAQGEESHRAIRCSFAVRAARVIAYAKAPGRYGRRLTHPVPPPDDHMHEVDRMLALAGELGIAPPRRAALPAYVPPETMRTAAQAWLAGRGLAPGAYVTVGLAARRWHRRPSAEQVARWARWWRNHHGLATVFVWTPGRRDDPVYPGDDDLAGQLLGMRVPDVHPCRGTLAHAIGVAWHARASVFPDSGLMHFAAASPGGVVGLFAGSGLGSRPHRWAPRGTRAAWIEARREIAAEPDERLYEAIAPLLEAHAPLR